MRDTLQPILERNDSYEGHKYDSGKIGEDNFRNLQRLMKDC